MQLTTYDIECLNRAKTFIDANTTQHHTIPEIAIHAGINTTKLRVGFKEQYGTGLYHYLKEQRMSHAIYLLKNTYKTLKEISDIAGYKHTCNFITAFKKRYGMAPRRWRNLLLLWIPFVQYLQEFPGYSGINL